MIYWWPWILEIILWIREIVDFDQGSIVGFGVPGLEVRLGCISKSIWSMIFMLRNSNLISHESIDKISYVNN